MLSYAPFWSMGGGVFPVPPCHHQETHSSGVKILLWLVTTSNWPLGQDDAGCCAHPASPRLCPGPVWPFQLHLGGVTWGPGADPGPVVLLPHPGRGWDTARTSAVGTQCCLHLCMEMRVVSHSTMEPPGHSLGKRNNGAGQRQRGGDGVMHPRVPTTGRSLQLRAHGHAWLGGCVLTGVYLRVLCVLSGLGTQGPKFASEFWKAGVHPSCLHGIDVVGSPSDCPHHVRTGHPAECSDDPWGRARGSPSPSCARPAPT